MVLRTMKATRVRLWENVVTAKQINTPFDATQIGQNYESNSLNMTILHIIGTNDAFVYLPEEFR